MNNPDCAGFLQWALPRLGLHWPGFRKVRNIVCKRLERRRRALGLASPDAYPRIPGRSRRRMGSAAGAVLDPHLAIRSRSERVRAARACSAAGTCCHGRRSPGTHANLLECGLRVGRGAVQRVDSLGPAVLRGISRASRYACWQRTSTINCWNVRRSGATAGAA